MNILTVGIFLACVASLATSESITLDCLQCFTSTCGPCTTECNAGYCSSECKSCLPKCVDCMVKNCEVSHNSPFAYHRE